MELKRIIFEDFLSFDHLDYEFEKRPLLIQGLNLTEKDQKTNGVGKSAIQTGIEICITSQNSRGVKDAELPTFGRPEANIQLFASCAVRKENIHIHWAIKRKGSNVVKVKTQSFGDADWNDAKFSNVNDGKKFILAWFAISKDDLFNYYLINSERFKSFFKSSQKENVDLINRFSDASIVDGIDKIDTTEKELEIESLERRIFELDGKVEYINGNIAKEKNRDFQGEFEDELEEIESEINHLEEQIENQKNDAVEIGKKDLSYGSDEDTLKDNIKTAEQDKILVATDISKMDITISDLSESLKTAQNAVSERISPDWEGKKNEHKETYEELDEEENEVNALKDKLNRQDTDLLKMIQKIDVTLSGSITCPKCSHEFLLDGDIEELKGKSKLAKTLIDKVSKEKIDAEATLLNIEKEREKVDQIIESIKAAEDLDNQDKQKLIIAANNITTSLNEAKDKMHKFKQELIYIDDEISNYEKSLSQIELDKASDKIKLDGIDDKIANLKESIKQKTETKDLLKKGNSDETIKELEEHKNKIEKDKKALLIEKDDLGDKLYTLNQWKDNFKGFRMYLANQSLETIAYHNNRYLTDLGSDMRVEIEGFKQLANKTFKDEITVHVVRNGIKRSFFSFSGGEKGRLLFASILTNRHLINSSHKYGGLDFLSIDEVLEGMDSLGLKNLIKPAKDLGITCQIITHVSDEDTNGDVLLVTKENDVSTIKRI